MTKTPPAATATVRARACPVSAAWSHLRVTARRNAPTSTETSISTATTEVSRVESHATGEPAPEMFGSGAFTHTVSRWCIAQDAAFRHASAHCSTIPLAAAAATFPVAFPTASPAASANPCIGAATRHVWSGTRIAAHDSGSPGQEALRGAGGEPCRWPVSPFGSGVSTQSFAASDHCTRPVTRKSRPAWCFHTVTCAAAGVNESIRKPRGIAGSSRSGAAVACFSRAACPAPGATCCFTRPA